VSFEKVTIIELPVLLRNDHDIPACSGAGNNSIVCGYVRFVVGIVTVISPFVVAFEVILKMVPKL
jgi:hypothetical protein